MFGIGGFELFLIVLFGFLIFGPDKLPEIAKTVGRAIAKFRDAQAEMSVTLKDVAFDKDSDKPFKNPFDAADKVADTTKRSAAAAKDTASEMKATVSAASASGEEGSDGVEAARESFSERKARYEQERIAKAKREAQAAPDPAPEQEGGA